jgi:nucleoside phosphorylase
MLIIFGALKIELIPLLKSIQINNILKTGKTIIYQGSKNSIPVLIIQTGMGAKNAKRAAEFFRDNYSEYIKRNSAGPGENTEVLMIGFCGAADRSIKVGDTIIYSSIKNIEHSGEESFKQNGIISLNSNRLSGSLLNSGFVTTTGANVPEVIIDPVVKKKLYADFDIRAIDMESYWVGKVALEMRLPFSCIRVVSDGALDILPSYYGETAGIKMTINIMLSFLRSIFNRKEFTANISALKNTKKANSKLRKVSAELISRLCQ